MIEQKMLSLADRIRIIRKGNKLSQVKFAEKLGADRSHISKIESGASLPSERLLKSICSIFSINYEWLKDGIGPMEGNRYPYKETGNRLKLARSAVDIDENQMSSLLGISSSNYQKYESGERLPGPSILSKISEIALASPEWILHGTDIKERPSRESEFSEAVDKLEHIFDFGSSPLLDFFKQLLDIATDVVNSGFRPDQAHDLLSFLARISELTSNEMRKTLESTEPYITKRKT